MLRALATGLYAALFFFGRWVTGGLVITATAVRRGGRWILRRCPRLDRWWQRLTQRWQKAVAWVRRHWLTLVLVFFSIVGSLILSIDCAQAAQAARSSCSIARLLAGCVFLTVGAAGITLRSLLLASRPQGTSWHRPTPSIFRFYVTAANWFFVATAAYLMTLPANPVPEGAALVGLDLSWGWTRTFFPAYIALLPFLVAFCWAYQRAGGDLTQSPLWLHMTSKGLFLDNVLRATLVNRAHSWALIAAAAITSAVSGFVSFSAVETFLAGEGPSVRSAIGLERGALVEEVFSQPADCPPERREAAHAMIAVVRPFAAALGLYLGGRTFGALWSLIFLSVALARILHIAETRGSGALTSADWAPVIYYGKRILSFGLALLSLDLGFGLCVLISLALEPTGDQFWTRGGFARPPFGKGRPPRW